MAQATINGVPVYKAVVSGLTTGIDKISLVDSPAVESLFVAFNEAKQLIYAIQDEEKRIVRGVVMRAGFPIYRNDQESGEYYIVYDKATIRQMAEKYLVDGKQNNVNLQHESNTDVDNVNMVQWFIKDSEAGISPMGFDSIADGSLFAEFHVENDDVWASVKDGTYKGFSLEGYFNLIPAQKTKLKKQENIMSKLKKIIQKLSTLLELGNITTDKAILYWDGEEDVQVGDSVYTEDADGNRVEAADGNYTTEDGTVIVVVGGMVEEIKTVEASPEDAPDTTTEVVEVEMNAVQKRIKAAEESYNDKFQLIREAVASVINSDNFYVQDAGDEFAIVAQYDENYNEKIYKYPLTIDNGVVTLGTPIEGKWGFIPLEESEEQPTEEVTILRTQLDEANKTIEKLQKQPIAKPAHEVVETSISLTKTGNKRLDRLATVLNASK